MDDGVKRLALLLKDERAILLSGRLRELSHLSAKKLREFDELRKRRACSPSELKELERMTAENHQLYEAAMAGLKSASKRLQSIRETRNGFNVYTREGQSAKLLERQQSKSIRT